MIQTTKEIYSNKLRPSSFCSKKLSLVRMSDQFCLRWNNYQASVTSAFKNLRDEEDFVDVTLCSEGKNLKAHKFVLSACSPYFKDLLKGINIWQHPVIILKDVLIQDLQNILEFVYVGEVNVSQEDLQSFLKTAELLEIKGLTDDTTMRPQIPLPTLPSGNLPTLPGVSLPNLAANFTLAAAMAAIPALHAGGLNSGKRSREITSPREKSSPKKVKVNESVAALFANKVKEVKNEIALKEEPLDATTDTLEAKNFTKSCLNGDSNIHDTHSQSSNSYDMNDTIEIENYENFASESSTTNHDEIGAVGFEGIYGQMFRGDAGSDSVACPVCYKMFASKSSMQRHQKEVHDKSTSVQCEVCHVVVGSRDRYLRHKREKHEDVQEYVCVDCNKVYHSKNSYVSHRSRYHRNIQESPQLQPQLQLQYKN